MFKTTIGSGDSLRHFTIEFRHLRADGRNPSLRHYKSSCAPNAITIATVVVSTPHGIEAISSDAAVCSPEDNFSRAFGRELALHKVCHKAGILQRHPLGSERSYGSLLLEEYIATRTEEGVAE